MKIGDKLYKYQGFGRIAEYECTGIIDRKECRLFEVECKSCSHGSHCLVLIKKADDGTYRFAAMANNDDQEPWHTTCTKPERYYESANDAKFAVYSDSIASCDAEIKRLGGLIKAQENRKEELAAHLKNIKDATK